MVFGRMVQQTDTGWLTVVEKNGLRLAADIFENHGIDSETDLSVIEPSSLNTPPAAALLSSKALNVVTSAAHLVGAAESVSENEGKNHQVGLKKSRY